MQAGTLYSVFERQTLHRVEKPCAGAPLGADCTRVWEPFRSIFEAAPEFLEKEERKLRVTRAIKARITSDLEFGCDLLIILAFFYVSSLLLDSRSTHFGGAVTKYRLHDVLYRGQQDDDR